MKLLIDQDLSAGAAEILRSTGFDVVHAREVGLSKADDLLILAWGREHGRVIGCAVSVTPKAIRVRRLPLVDDR